MNPKFFLGCNYWSSHAGTAMWSDWRPDIVEADLDRLAAIGVETLRVFPLWPDFQPIHLLDEVFGRPREYRFGEEPLPATAEGQAGVSVRMLDRFESLLHLAHARQMRVLPALITGWMSGRLFVPPALQNRQILSDPEALKWQLRFVRIFVRRFASHPAIVAWGLGNECNCMGKVSRAEAWRWSASVSATIRAEDPSRPVVSGMHTLDSAPTAESQTAWTIQDQGELTDILTVHPYPLFTPHCDRDPLDSFRGCLHATAEGVLYGDVGGRPCLVEEIGTLSSCFGSEGTSARYLRAVLYSLWSHGNLGMLWWCAFDQDHLEQAPYDWYAFERELGLLRGDGEPKPVAETLRGFSAFLREAPQLSAHLREAVCLLSDGQDAWGAAFASFMLAKQAGFDLTFQNTNQPLRDSSLYLLPSLKVQPSRRFCQMLMEKVAAGATLYVSHDDAVLAQMREWLGLEVVHRSQRVSPAIITFGNQQFEVESPYRLHLQPSSAKVLAVEADGNPAFTCHYFGKGKVYFLTVPLESWLVRQPAVMGDADGTRPPWTAIYEDISEDVRKSRVLLHQGGGHPTVGSTEHPREDGSCHIVIINYGAKAVDFPVQVRGGWKIGSVLRGEFKDDCLSLAANDAGILIVEKA